MLSMKKITTKRDVKVPWKALPEDVWLHLLGFCGDDSIIQSRALQTKYVKTFTTFTTMAGAVRGGSLRNMKWLKERGCLVDSRTFTAAAESGKLETIKWLKAISCSTFEAAATSGNLECLK